LGASGTFSGLRATQVSSVTDLMQELTRQRRVTTRLLSGLLLLVGLAMIVGLYFVLQRPAPSPVAMNTAPAPLLAKPTAAAAAATPVTIVPSATVDHKTHAPTISAVAPPRAAALLQPLPHGAKPDRRSSAAPTFAAEADIATPASAPAPAVAETGQLNLDTTPWSVVSVGGRVLGQTPLVGVTLPAGTHTLVLSNPEQGLKTTYQVTISAGRVTARRIGLD
jgi:serine/threonine-protein kinase